MRLIKFFLLFSLISNQLAFAYDGDPFPDCKDVGIKPASLYEPLSAWFDRVRKYHEPGYIPDSGYELFMVCDKSAAVCMYQLNGRQTILCGALNTGYDTTIQTLTTELSINQICNTLKVGNAKHAGSSYLLCPLI
jgi:hypothetical protein